MIGKIGARDDRWRAAHAMPNLRRAQPSRAAMIATALRLAALVLSTLLSLSQISWASMQINREYCGKAISNGEWVDVVTRLTTGPDGLLSGTYEFEDNGEMAPGTLREQGKHSEVARVLTWMDKYGTGTVVMSFAPDRASFTGLWGLGDDFPGLGWNGGSCEANTV
jgi:hypothetical protein